ncbi:MAG: hypothetical protein GYB66_09080 [Chloroflexi bacterium]|nr:hypothetical protein [Chloroflexota bacterium]
MTLDELTEQLPLLTGGSLLIGIVLFLLATLLFRQSRGGTFWFRRRRAGKRGFRALVASFGFLSLSAALCAATIVFNMLEDDTSNDSDDDSPVVVVTGQTPGTSTLDEPSPTAAEMATETPRVTASATETQIVETNTPTVEPSITRLPMTVTATETSEPGSDAIIATEGGDDERSPTEMPASTVQAAGSVTAAPTNTPSLAPSDTEAPTASQTVTPTPTSTLTLTLTVTAQPSATNTPVTPTLAPSRTPFPTLETVLNPPSTYTVPQDNATVRIAAIASQIDADWEAVESQSAFPAGVRRLYFFISYNNMSLGAEWRWALFKDDVFLDGRSLAWGLETSGEAFFFYGRAAGFPPGEYEMRIYIGDRPEPVDQSQFIITGD